MYFVDGEPGPDQVTDLPDHLLCSGTLDESLDQIKQFIRSWIEAGNECGSSQDRIRNLGITLIGPFPEEQCIVDRRSPEQRLAESA